MPGLAQHVVDNRTFLIGLDAMFRDVMKAHESGELLECARAVAATLGTAPSGDPIEGYYAETPALTEYFRRMRGLQAVPRARAAELGSSHAYARLAAVTGSAIFGPSGSGDSILPRGIDSLAHALRELAPHWTGPALVARARERAIADDDCSFVGLAARAGDPVMLAAYAETVVLYRAPIPAGVPAEPPGYAWRVDDDLARAANRFLSTFNALFGTALPSADASSAARYWHAAQGKVLTGRCVRLGYDDSVTPTRHYHWAVHRAPNGELAVTEFWATELWTTQRYRAWLAEAGARR